MSDLNKIINEQRKRITELEKEVERLNAHSLIFDAASELNDDLKKKLEAAERERDESDDDLKYTQKQLSEIETKFESISLLFCDADGNPFFEPFDAGSLFLWLNKFAIKQRIAAIEWARDKGSHCRITYSLYETELQQLRQQLNGSDL